MVNREQENRDERNELHDTINRRDVLKGAATTAAAAAAGGFAGTAVAQEDYDTITANGQTITVGQGESFENYLIDLSTGNDFTLRVDGGNSTIRNVGFEGIYRGGGFILSISSLASDTGHVLIENVYIGDGATKEGSDFVHGPGGVFYHRDANVDVTFRYCNVQGYPNNGFYCSNSVHGGSITWENCYAKNNGVSSYRAADGNDEIINCVAYNDDTEPYFPGRAEDAGRPVWAWNPGAITIEDSDFHSGLGSNTYPYALVAGANGEPSVINYTSGDFQGDIQEAHGSSINISSSVGNNPDLSPPAGCPTSAVQAASGGGDDGGGSPPSGDCEGYPDHEHIYEFHADDSDEPSDYYLEIEDGSHLLAVTESEVDSGEAVIDHVYTWISDDGTRAAGRVFPGERHAYRFSTPLCDVTIEGDAEAYIDGDESSLGWFPQDCATGDGWKGDFPWQQPDRTHIYEFDASDADDYTDYYLEIEDGDELLATTESELSGDAAFHESFYWISDDGTRAAGRVYPGERHAYTFDNNLCDVTVDGPADAYINGSESSLGWFPQDCATGDGWKGGFDWQGEHLYEFRADDADTYTDYYVEIEAGPMVAAPENGAHVDFEYQWVSEDATLAAGRVFPGERHAFRFDADMCDVTVDGPADPYINGDESSLGWFPQDCACGDDWKGGFPWQE